jgi:F0F1-type ATP synthase epsilon subunit
VATPFHAELVTPEKVLFSGDVEEVSMRTDEGEISFLAAHEDYVAAVDITVVRLSVVAGGRPGAPATAASGPASGAPAGGPAPARPGSGAAGAAGAAGAPGGDDEPGVLRAAVHGGFVQVDQSGVVILASVAELAGEIDVERARHALETAAQAPSTQAGAGAPGGDAQAGAGAQPVASGQGAAAPGQTVLSPAMLALLEPDAPEARARRAQARLEAAGVA